jgi:phage gp37-like protein
MDVPAGSELAFIERTCAEVHVISISSKLLMQALSKIYRRQSEVQERNISLVTECDILKPKTEGQGLTTLLRRVAMVNFLR